MNFSKVIGSMGLIALGFALGLIYPNQAPGSEPRSEAMTEKAIHDYLAKLPNIDLHVINESFFYSQPGLIEVHRRRPDIMCRDLAHKFGLLLDENEIEMRIDFFQPGDSIPVWQKDLYFASARYLRKNCGNHAAKWMANSPVWKSYKKAVKFAVITQ